MKRKSVVHKSSSWETLVSEGKEAGRERDLRLSALHFEQAYEGSRAFPHNDPRRGESAYYLAYARYIEGKNTEAVKLFEEALSFLSKDAKQLPRCAQIHSILAAIHFGMRQLDIAEIHTKHAIQIEEGLSKESWENVQLLSSILVSLHKYEEAIPVLEKLTVLQKENNLQDLAKTKAILSYARKKVEEERNKQPVRSIGAYENQIARELFPRVKEFLFLLGRTYTLSGLVLESAYPERNPTLAKQVCTKLLMRMSSDLRAIIMLAEVGYDVQANALAASVYECAFTIGTISDKSDMAKKWLEHSDPKKSFGDAKSLTKLALQNFSKEPQLLEQFYKIYRQLCWGKHLNPISEQQGGIERSGNTIDYKVGPRSDELTERGIAFCCTYTVFFACVGLEMFIRQHVGLKAQSDLLNEVTEISERRNKLVARAVEKWGSADPFPGKW